MPRQRVRNGPRYFQTLKKSSCPAYVQLSRSFDSVNFSNDSFFFQVTHWQSPYMHAYFPALNSYPSLLGDMLANGINCLGFTWVSCFLSPFFIHKSTSKHSDIGPYLDNVRKIFETLDPPPVHISRNLSVLFVRKIRQFFNPHPPQCGHHLSMAPKQPLTPFLTFSLA